MFKLSLYIFNYISPSSPPEILIQWKRVQDSDLLKTPTDSVDQLVWGTMVKMIVSNIIKPLTFFFFLRKATTLLYNHFFHISFYFVLP